MLFPMGFGPPGVTVTLDFSPISYRPPSAKIRVTEEPAPVVSTAPTGSQSNLETGPFLLVGATRVALPETEVTTETASVVGSCGVTVTAEVAKNVARINVLALTIAVTPPRRRRGGRVSLNVTRGPWPKPGLQAAVAQRLAQSRAFAETEERQRRRKAKKKQSPVSRIGRAGK